MNFKAGFMTCNQRKPDWLKIKLPTGELSQEVSNTIKIHKLNTICTSGKCSRGVFL